MTLIPPTRKPEDCICGGAEPPIAPESKETSTDEDIVDYVKSNPSIARCVCLAEHQELQTRVEELERLYLDKLCELEKLYSEMSLKLYSGAAYGIGMMPMTFSSTSSPSPYYPTGIGPAYPGSLSSPYPWEGSKWAEISEKLVTTAPVVPPKKKSLRCWLGIHKYGSVISHTEYGPSIAWKCSRCGKD